MCRFAFYQCSKRKVYVNIRSLANLESLKDRRNKLSKSFFKKCSPLTVACMLFSHQNAIMKSCLDYVTPRYTLSLLLEQKDTSPLSTIPWLTTKNNVKINMLYLTSVPVQCVLSFRYYIAYCRLSYTVYYMHIFHLAILTIFVLS